MKAIMISIKPKWCAKMMNGEKTIEVRRNKALANTIQKLIDEYGYADIYVHCSKINKKHYHLIKSIDTDTDKTEYEIDYYIGSEDYLDWCFDGKVAFKFRCYKVEEIEDYGNCYLINKDYPHTNKVARESCLDFVDLKNYLKGNNGYAIHISSLVIFDKPKELYEFSGVTKTGLTYIITKAPQSFCYIEAEE